MSRSACFEQDCAVVGASFAALACARVLAHAGLRVAVYERNGDPGEKLHTTGIIVKEVVDQVALLDGAIARRRRRPRWSPSSNTSRRFST